MIKLGIIGLGRIGRIHLENAQKRLKGCEVIAAVNPSSRGREFARSMGVPFLYQSYEAMLNRSDLDAVLICSPTDQHARQVKHCIEQGIDVFCEKPLDFSIPKIKALGQAAKSAGVKLMLGFNQRFDGEFSALQASIAAGKAGDLHIVRLTSRDPGPPPISYIKSSGGLFLDMTIHDFDMARFLVGSEVEDVMAFAEVRIDPAIGEAGDVDTALISLRFKNGTLVSIDNSRKAVYGYDQRAEAFGSKGMLATGNRLHHLVLSYDEEGGHLANPLDFFMDRYEESYLKELQAFLRAIEDDSPVPVGAHDALMATAIGLAAGKSVQEKRLVKLSEIIP